MPPYDRNRLHCAVCGRQKRERAAAATLFQLHRIVSEAQESVPMTASMRFFMVEASKGLMM